MKRYALLLVAAILLIGVGSRYVTRKPIQDAGGFRVVYDPVENPDYSRLQRTLKEAKLFERIAEDLNREFALPVDVSIHLAECKRETAYYDPGEKRIVICYELLGHLAELFSAYLKSEEELGEAVLRTSFFVFYHEVGHALIDVLGLPTTGREEDAVDQLATLVLIDSGEEGVEAALDAASWFLLRGAQNTDIERLPFWDEHALDEQRFYTIACLVYGHNPQKYSDLVTDGTLPKERAERCEDEYQRMSASWGRLLSPHSKK